MLTLENPKTQRLNGLDTLRTIAIVIVLMYHYSVVVSHESTFGFATDIGWTGVDLFFVLSGYLIGNQLLSSIGENKNFSLKLFYIRRLLRTLPNYYVVLALYYLFPLTLSGLSTASLWSFLTFTQNFSLRPGETFTHSWSLCIEEQFYLLLPLILLAVFKARHSVAIAWTLLLSGFLIAMSLRGFMWFTHGQAAITAADFWENIYYWSPTRFDELLPGVAIAMFKNFHKDAFQKITQYGNTILIAGVLCAAVMFYLLTYYFYIDNYGFSLVMTIVSYSLLAISFGILVLAALCSNSLLNKIRIPGAASIALWSYAIYLIHKPLFLVLQAPLAQFAIDAKSPASIAFIMGMSLFCGWLLFICVETPFMKLRSRYYSTNRNPANNHTHFKTATSSSLS